MPETIGFLLLSAAGVTEIAGFAVTASTAAIVGNVALAAGAIGLSYALSPSVKAPAPQDGQITTRQPLPNRRRNYGLVKVSGPLMFSETQNGNRYQVMAVNQGEIDSVVQHWFADGPGTVDGSGLVTDRYGLGATRYVNLYFLPGTLTDPALARLIADFSTLWTSAHQGKGIAKALLVTAQPPSDKFTTVYPGGQPPIYRAVLQSSRVWDPRLVQDRNDPATWTYSTNPVLIALDYHRHVDGMGLAIYDTSFFNDDAINEDWIPAANICDEAMTKKDSSVVARYQCCGGYDLAAAPKDTLASILATCDGQTYQRSDGAIGIRVGKTIAPTVTISDAHILGYEGFRNGPPSSLIPVNQVTAKYTDTDLDFQEVAADPWLDIVAIGATGRAEIRDVPLLWVPDHAQARRLMKLAIHRFNPAWSGRIITDLDGLRAWGERYINLQIAELGITGTFEMTAPPEFMPASMTVILTVASLDASAFAWDALTEEGTAPVVPTPGASTDVIADPTSVALVSVVGKVISFSWDSPVRGDEVPDAQYSGHGLNNWFNASVNGGLNGAVTPVLPSGTYDVQVRWRVGTNASNFVPIISIVIP